MGGFVIDNPDRELMMLYGLQARLKVMIKLPGGQWQLSPISITNDKYGTSFRNAAPCLDFIDAQIKKRVEELTKA